MDNNYGTSLDISKEIEHEKKLDKAMKKPPKEPQQADKPAVPGNRFSRYLMPAMILILIIITIFVRLETADMPLFDRQAEQKINQSIISMIQSDLSKEKDILPNEIPKVAEQRYQQAINDPRTEAIIQNTSEKYKTAFRDYSGQIYLYGADSYYYYRQADDYLEDGTEPEQNLPYIYVYFYKFVSTFNRDFTLENAVFYLPIIFAVLSVVILFFIGRKLAGDTGGFIAALFLSLNSSFLLNTRPGFFDTNSFNIFISLLIVLLFIHTIDFRKKSVYAGILLLASLLIFSMIWTGWFYILLILLLYLIIYFFMDFAFVKFRKLTGRKKAYYLSFIGLALISFIFIVDRYKLRILKKLQLDQGFYPSGSLTVAELSGYSINDIAYRFGGYLVLVFVIAVLAYLIYKNLKHIKSMDRYHLFIIIYFLSMALIPLIAKRFTVFFVPAYSLVLGLGVSMAIPYLAKSARQLHLSISRDILKIVFLVLISLFIAYSMNDSLKANMLTVPHMNDAIYNTATAIKYNSSEDAVINLWWDYGYLYEAIAERDVAFHGGSHNNPRIYWIPKALMADDENLSAGILRMLNCGGEKRAVSLLKKEVSKPEAVALLDEILVLDKEQAQGYLQANNFPKNVVKYTHCESPESFFVVGSELQKKVHILDYYANFDFRLNQDKIETKGMQYDEAVSYLMEKNSMKKGEAEDYYMEVRQFDPNEVPITYLRSESQACSLQSEIVTCGNGFRLNKTSMQISHPKGPPQELIYYNQNITRIEYESSDIEYSAIIIDDKSSFLVNPRFDDSVFFSLLYLDGTDLDNFELFSKETNPQRVMAYRIKNI